MTLALPLQLSALGRAAAALFFLGTAGSIVVGLFVGYRAFRAHRRTGRRRLLLFSVGLLLLVSVSKLVNVALATALSAETYVVPAAELVRLAGAVVITYAIYDR